MLPTLSLSTIFTKLLNLAVETNPNIDLLPLEGRSFAITIDELPQDIGIKVINQHIIALTDDEIASADVTVSGNIRAIINMIQNESDGLENDDLYIAGKISTAKNFQHFLASLRIDWQGFFAKFLPEQVAYKTADVVEQSLQFAKGSSEQLIDSLKSYLLEDKKLFVSRSEFKQHQTTLLTFTHRLDAILQQLK